MRRVVPAPSPCEIDYAVEDDARADTLHMGNVGLHGHAGEPEKSTGAKNRGPAHEGNLNGAIDPRIPRLHCNWQKRRCHFESKCIAITRSSKDDCVGFVRITWCACHQVNLSQRNITYTRTEKQFTMVRAYKITGVDYRSGPYSGGTEILVTGEVKTHRHVMTNLSC